MDVECSELSEGACEMSIRYKVADQFEIPEGTGQEFVVADKVIAIFHVDGDYYAMDGLCPHAGGPIGTGNLRGCIVTCPWHGWQFDVTTGESKLSRVIKSATFPLVRDAEGWWLELPDKSGASS